MILAWQRSIPYSTFHEDVYVGSFIECRQHTCMQKYRGVSLITGVSNWRYSTKNSVVDDFVALSTV